MKKLIALILAVMMIACCFAGCQPSAPQETQGDTQANTPADTQAQEKTIVVGYTIYEPMNYQDEATGELIGFDTELAEAVFAKLGYKVMFQLIDWGSKYTDLNAGTIDCVWNGFTCNTSDDDGVARADKVDFSYNYMENRQVIVVKKDSGIAAAADLNGKMGAAEGGSAGETYGQGFEGASIKTFPYQTDCLMEVKAGTADAAVLDWTLAMSMVGEGTDFADLKMIDGVELATEEYGIAFRQGSDFTAKVDEAVKALVADGTLPALAEKYGLALAPAIAG